MSGVSGRIVITKLRAQSLPAKDVGGSSDPYYKISWPDGSDVRSPVIEKTLNPTYNQTHEYSFNNVGPETTFRIEFWDKDTIGKDEFLGATLVRFSQLWQDMRAHFSTVDVGPINLGDQNNNSGEFRGQLFLTVTVDAPAVLDWDLYSSDTARVNAVLTLLTAEGDSHPQLFNEQRLGRIFQLAAVPNDCEPAAFGLLLKRSRDPNAARQFINLFVAPSSHYVALRSLYADTLTHSMIRGTLAEVGFYAAAAQFFATNPPAPNTDADALARELSILLQAGTVGERPQSAGAAAILGNNQAIIAELENMLFNPAYNLSPPNRASVQYALALAYGQKRLEFFRADPTRLSTVFNILFNAQNQPDVVRAAITSYRELLNAGMNFDSAALWANINTLHTDVILTFVVAVNLIPTTGAVPDERMRLILLNRSNPPPSAPPGSAPPPSASSDPGFSGIPVPGGVTPQGTPAFGSFGVTIVLLTGQRVPISVGPNDLIAMIKLQVQSGLNIPTADQRLIFNGRQLDDDTMTVAATGIVADSVIHIAVTNNASTTAAPPAGAPTSQAHPSYVVDYFLPERDDEGNFCAYEVPVAHIVLQQKDKVPFTLTHAVLKVPNYIYCPTKTVAIFMCESLPDISKSVAYDNVDSVEQFFSIPPPQGIHPAIFLDNRNGPNIMTYASAVSRWLSPCKYVYVRLLSSGFPDQGYKAKKHELEFLGLIGVNGNLAAGVDGAMLARIDTGAIVARGPEPIAEFVDPSQQQTEGSTPYLPQPGGAYPPQAGGFPAGSALYPPQQGAYQGQGAYQPGQPGYYNPADYNAKYNPGYTSNSVTYVYNNVNTSYPPSYYYGSTFYPRYYSAGYGWRPYYQPTCYRPYVPKVVYRPTISIGIGSGGPSIAVRPSPNVVIAPHLQIHSNPTPAVHPTPSPIVHSPFPQSNPLFSNIHTPSHTSPPVHTSSPIVHTPAPAPHAGPTTFHPTAMSHPPSHSAPSHSAPSHSGFGSSHPGSSGVS